MSQIIGNEKLIIAEMRKPWTFPFLKMELVNKAGAILGPAEAHLDKWTSSGDKARWTGGQFPMFKTYSISNLFQYLLNPVSPLRCNDKTIWKGGQFPIFKKYPFSYPPCTLLQYHYPMSHFAYRFWVLNIARIANAVQVTLLSRSLCCSVTVVSL